MPAILPYEAISLGAGTAEGGSVIFKFLHAADLHLDSPLLGLASKSIEFAERIEEASRRAFDNLVDLAIAEGCRFVIFAGDIFDGDLRNMRTGLFFVSRVRRLTDAGVAVFMVLGNHDAEHAFIRKLDLGPHVEVFPAKKAETVRLADVGVALHGRSFPKAELTENIARDYPVPVPGLFNIGVLHTACEGREGPHARYAPCSLEQLVNHGYQYWALGHVHGTDVLNEHPFVVYPGNLQGRQPRETGPNGAMIATVDDGEVVSLEHYALDTIRWASVEVDATTAAAFSEVVEALAGALKTAVSHATGRALAVRLTIGGRSVLSTELELRQHELRDRAFEIAAGLSDDLWIERLLVTVTAPPEAAALDHSLAGLIAGEIAAIAEPEIRARLEKTLTEIRDKMPAGARADVLFDRLREEAPTRARAMAAGLLAAGPADAL